MVDDVVAVRAARPRLEEGRQIDMADAEARQIGRERRRLGEAEPLVELQPIGGARSGSFASQAPAHAPWAKRALRLAAAPEDAASPHGKAAGCIGEVGVEHEATRACRPRDADRLFAPDDE